MGKGTEQIKLLIQRLFPELVNDKHFKLTSPQDACYNCIAWAYNYKDRWMWPPKGMPTNILDAVTYWPNENSSDDVSEFIRAFKEGKGYEICENADYEKGYQKIALYVKKGTTKCTHAARQLTTGFWTSKLGQAQDIQHGTPYTIEGDKYGKVYCIMKRRFP